MSARHLIKSLAKGIGYFLAFAAPALTVTYLVVMNAQATLTAPARQPYAGPLLPAPAHDPAKPTVAIVASNNGTEITDFLAPYEVFAATGAFNVYAVAPKRAFTPFMWGGVDIMPHYSFAELEQLLGGNPDVIVVPFIKDYENPEIIQWIGDHAGSDTQVVSICGGALVLAATGLVDEGKVTTHQGVFPLLEKNFPHIQTVRGVRYTDNGNSITSAGITAGVDASLYTVQKLLGKEMALATARKLNYPHIRFLDDPAYLPDDRQAAGLAANANAGLVWQKREFGVYLFDGVGEIDLTAVLDTYGRTFTARTITFAEQRDIIRSRYGLYLVPRLDFANLSGISRIIVPGSESALGNGAAFATWAQEQHELPVEYLYPAGTTEAFAFDRTLPDLAHWSSRSDAHSAATTLEYPAEHLELTGRSWPLHRLLSVLLVGLAGVGLVMAVKTWWRVRAKPASLATA